MPTISVHPVSSPTLAARAGACLGALIHCMLRATPSALRGALWRAVRALVARTGGGWAVVFLPADLFDSERQLLEARKARALEVRAELEQLELALHHARTDDERVRLLEQLARLTDRGAR